VKKEEAAGLFTLAGIQVLAMYELVNPYWPRNSNYYKTIVESPWWLVKTKYGNIQIGWRKRVICIDWADIAPLRKVITADDVTKDLDSIHAWSNEKALEYLTALGKEIKNLSLPQ
jgi:hypothetical protein